MEIPNLSILECPLPYNDYRVVCEAAHLSILECCLSHDDDL